MKKRGDDLLSLKGHKWDKGFGVAGRQKATGFEFKCGTMTNISKIFAINIQGTHGLIWKQGFNAVNDSEVIREEGLH